MIEYISKRRCFLIASKGQKFNKYTDEYKREIIEKFQKGSSSTYLAREYGISRFTILTWMKKINNPDKYASKNLKRGRPKEKDLTKEDWKERYKILKKYQAFLKGQREKK